jgi:tetratricopeptide (TPR) repeat protein
MVKKSFPYLLILQLFIFPALRGQYRYTYLTLGKRELWNENFMDAINYFSYYIHDHPNLYEAYYLRGLAKYNLGDLSGAELDFTRSITCIPEFPRLYLVRGIVRTESYKFKEALDDFNTAIDMDSSYSDGYFYRALNYLSMGEYTLALHDVNRVIGTDSTYSNIFLLRGAIYAQIRLFPEAIQDFNYCISNDPKNERAYIERGSVYAQTEAIDLAMNDFEHVLALDSTNAYAYFQRGLVKMKIQDYEGALHDLNKVLELSPENELALFNRALVKSSTRSEWEAIDDFIHILNQNPDNMLVYFNLGIILVQSGNYYDAINSFNTAIELYPDYAEAYYQRALVKREIGDLEEAYRDMQQFEILNKKNLEKNDSTKYQEGLEILRLTHLSDDFIREDEKKNRVQYEEAEIELQPIFQPVIDSALILKNWRSPSSGKLEFTMKSQPFYSENKHTDSVLIDRQIEILDSLIDEDMYCSEYYLKRGALYTLLNNPVLAVEDFNKALSLNPSNTIIHLFRSIANISLLQIMTRQETRVPILPKTHNIEELRVYSDIIYDLQKITEPDPDYIFARFNLGYARFLMEDYTVALSDFSYVASKKKIAEAHFNKALLQIFFNEKDQGCTELGIAGELGLKQAYPVIRKLCY